MTASAVRAGSGTAMTLRRLTFAVAILALLPATLRYLTTQYVSGDTNVLLQDVHAIFRDVAHGQWHSWGGHFPLLQQVPAALFVSAGLDDSTVTRALVVLNLVALAGLTTWGGLSLRRRSSTVAALFVAVILAGPMPWYGHASFNEMLAALFTMGVVISLIDGAGGVVVAALVVMAAIAKDTALPFVVLLALGAAFVSGRPSEPSHGRPGWRDWPRRLRLGPIAVGGVIAALLTAGFNYLRFGSVLNLNYFDPRFIVPSLSIQLKFLLGIWVSPNGGVVPFWPTLAAFLLLAGVAAIVEVRRAGSGGERLQRAVPVVVAVLVLGGLSLGLSKFVSPLGWITWGPRYLIPWLPAVAYFLAASHAGQIAAIANALRRNLLAFAAVVVLGVASLPQYLILFRLSLWDSLFAPDSVCPQPPYIEKGQDYYYRCSVHMLLTKHSILLDAYHAHIDRGAFLLAAVCTVAWVVLVAGALLMAQPTPSRIEPHD